MTRWQDEDAIRKWRYERAEAVAKLDTEEYRKFYNRWTERGYYSAQLPDDEQKLMSDVCQLAVSLDGIPNGRKEEAREWLRVHDPGYNWIHKGAAMEDARNEISD